MTDTTNQTEPPTELVERVAVAIANVGGVERWPNCGEFTRDDLRDDARAALAALSSDAVRQAPQDDLCPWRELYGARCDLEEVTKGQAAELRKYWLDWPQARRDAVKALSSFVFDAIEAIARPTVEVEYTAGGGLNPAPGPVPAALEVDDESGTWYVRLCDEPVATTTTQRGPVHVDWTKNGRMVGIELLPRES